MRIKYLCLLAHRKYPKAPDYGKWQRKIIKKYKLWAFSYITEDQVEEEIKKFD